MPPMQSGPLPEHVRTTDDNFAAASFGSECRQMQEPDSLQRTPGSRQVVKIPQGYSPDFAYVLGAFAATVRGERADELISFSNKDEECLERLCTALQRSCSYGTHILQHQIRGVSFPLVAISNPELIRELASDTKWNAYTPWHRLLTRAERLEFLKGFFDFAGGGISEKTDRLTITRKDNHESLIGVGIILKREGVLSHIAIDSSAHLYVEDKNDLRKLACLGVVVNKHLGEPLSLLSQSEVSRNEATPEAYDRVMSKFEELRSRSKDKKAEIYASQVLHAIGVEGGIPMKELMQAQRWIDGQVPKSVKRLRNLERMESDLLFKPETIASVGRAILARVSSESSSPGKILSAALEWHGTREELARVTKINPARVSNIFASAVKPTPSEYFAIVRATGICPIRDLGLMETEPGASDVISWIPRNQRGIYYTYSGALLKVAREAYYSLEQPKQKVRQKIAELMDKHSIEQYGSQY